MKRIRYAVAVSLDGYIAGSNGEYDWIVHDPEVNFAEIWAQFDTLIMGRETYELAVRERGRSAFAGMKTVVLSRTLRQADHPNATIISELTRGRIRELREQTKRDIWLFGGGQAFRSMLQLGEVDTVETGVIPILLGGGIPLLPAPAAQAKLKLTSSRAFRSGILRLCYEVQK